MKQLLSGVMMRTLATAGVVLGLAAVGNGATPNITSAVIHTRVFNDDPGSTVTFTDAYPVSISINDSGNTTGGFANLHTWRFSENNFTDAQFSNGGKLQFCTVMNLDGDGEGEGGIQISPWYSPQVDGRLNVRTTDGEIAAFGGRLPFYSFSNPAGHDLRYTKGDDIGLCMRYDPNGLSMASPATIQYTVIYNTTTYESGPLPFDEGNPAEAAEHGTWGILSPAYAGGHVQRFLQEGSSFGATFAPIIYAPEPAALGLLLIGGLLVSRRRASR